MSNISNCSLCFERDTIHNPTYRIHERDPHSSCACRMHRRCYEIWTQELGRQRCFLCPRHINPGIIASMPIRNIEVSPRYRYTQTIMSRYIAIQNPSAQRPTRIAAQRPVQRPDTHQRPVNHNHQ